MEKLLHDAIDTGDINIMTSIIDANLLVVNAKYDSFLPLNRAILKQRIDISSLLLNRGANVNDRDEYGSTALYCASSIGRLDIATLLLEHGADIEAKDNHGMTALHWASRNGYLGIVTLLLEHGADIEAKNNNGKTALHFASKHGTIGVVQCLVNHNADVNAQTCNLRTPLHFCCFCWEYSSSSSSLLIEYGADLDLADKDGITPRQLILNNFVPEFLQECLDKRQQRIFDLSDFLLTCTDLKYAFPLAIVVAEFIHGDMPKIKPNKRFESDLYYACSNNDYDTVKHLLGCGADPLKHSSDRGDTSLHMACKNGFLNIVHLLLNHTDNVDVLRDNNVSSLHEAVDAGHNSIVILLIEKGANVNVQRYDGFTPLHSACFSKRVNIARILLRSADIDIEIRDFDFGSTALHFACFSGSVDVIQLLLKHSAKTDIPNKVGAVPLHFACHAGNIEAIELLIDNSTINAKRSDNATPLLVFLNTAKDDKEIVSLLIEFGADVDVSSIGETARSIIIERYGLDFLLNCFYKRKERIEKLSKLLLLRTDLFYAWPLAYIVAEFVYGSS